MIRGLDIASYQGYPDFDRVAAEGIEFVVCKATEGVGYVNPTFEPNWPAIRRAGLVRGAYHYAQPDFNQPEAEASHFLAAVGPLLPGDLLALDIEAGSGNLVDWALRWLIAVETATGVVPLLYSGRWFMVAHGLYDERLARYPLWLAYYVYDPSNWPTPPPYWDEVTLWQWSETDNVAAIPGNEDANLYRGTADDLRQLGFKGEEIDQMDQAVKNETLLRLDEIDDLARKLAAGLSAPRNPEFLDELLARTNLVRNVITQH